MTRAASIVGRGRVQVATIMCDGRSDARAAMTASTGMS